MLSRTRCDNEEDMMDSKEDVGTNFYSMALGRQEGVCLDTHLESFLEELYEGEWLYIERYLGTLERQEGWTDHEFKRTRRKAFGYFV